MATLLQNAFAKESLLACKGFNPLFIDKNVNIDINKVLSGTLKKSLPVVEGNKDGVLNYTNMSVLYNADRRVPFFAAYNIDGSEKKKVKRTVFKPDPRIDKKIQLSQKGFYDLRKDVVEFEIGHMAANNEMAWGKDAQFQSFQTFHYPNSVPQAENLNTGIWKTLETYIVNEAASIKNNKRICIFTGPVLRNIDPEYIKDRKFQIPLLFFKVIVFPTSKGLYSTAFVMSHEQRMIELGMLVLPGAVPGTRAMREAFEPDFSDFPYKEVFQVNIDLLEELSGLNFSWTGVKRLQVPDKKNQITQICSVANKNDIQAAGNNLRGFTMPEIDVAGKEITAKEIEKGNVKLNIILP